MKWEDVQAALAQGEGSRVEFKSKLAPDRIKDALCAFANTEGGVLVLGVADDGCVVGIDGDRDEVQKTLTNLLQSGLSAPIVGVPDSVLLDGKWLHWVDVPRQRGPKPVAVGGRVRVRRGRSNHLPGDAELQDLLTNFGFVLTEEQAVPGTCIADIDQRTFYSWLRDQGVDVSAEPQLAATVDLRNRGVLVQRPGEDHGSLYGLLCFGLDPQRHRQMGGHFIHCTAFAGPTRGDDTFSVTEARGCVDQQVRAAEAWYQTLGHRERIVGLLREESGALPMPVIREVLTNAVAHRDYGVTGSKILFDVFTDRIEVTSPGELPNHVRKEGVLGGGVTLSRNQMIANFLFSKQFMDRRGLGFPKMTRLLRLHGHPDPMLDDDRIGRFVRVTLRLRGGGGFVGDAAASETADSLRERVRERASRHATR